MNRLVYLSRAKSWLEDDHVQEIVNRSAENNYNRGITGFLCLRDGFFLQYLEGEEAPINDLYSKLCEDDRHDIVRTVLLNPCDEKQFFDWSMRWLDRHFLGQLALEDKLVGVMTEFGRGKIDENRVLEMAERLVDLIAHRTSCVK